MVIIYRGGGGGELVNGMGESRLFMGAEGKNISAPQKLGGGGGA